MTPRCLTQAPWSISVALSLFATGAGGNEIVSVPSAIESDSPFSPSGTVEQSPTKLLRITEVHKTESGVLNGVHYHFFYTDGSGTFAGRPGNTGHFSEPSKTNWTVGCKKDAMSDKKHCSMRLGSLWIYAFPRGRVTVSIGADHYPGSNVAIRIDAGTPVSHSSRNDGDFPPDVSARVVQQLKRANTVTTRYMEWPYRAWVDDTWELYGFNEAYQYITWAVSRLK